MSKLKECPICGGEIKQMFMNEESFQDCVWDESVGNVSTWFKCYECDSEFFHDEPIDSPEKQAEWWNTRKPTERVVKRLEDASYTDTTGMWAKIIRLSDAIEIVKEEGDL